MIDKLDLAYLALPNELLRGVTLSYTDRVRFEAASYNEWAAMDRAAVLAHQGRHDEAEATRFAGGYANLDDVSVPCQRALGLAGLEAA